MRLMSPQTAINATQCASLRALRSWLALQIE